MPFDLARYSSPQGGPRSAEVIAEVEAKLQQLLKLAKAILAADHASALLLANRLVANRVLTGAEIMAVLEKRRQRDGTNTTGMTKLGDDSLDQQRGFRSS